MWEERVKKLCTACPKPNIGGSRFTRSCIAAVDTNGEAAARSSLCTLILNFGLHYYKDIRVWCGSSDSKNTGVRSSVTLNNGSIPMARVQLGRNIKVTYLKNLFPPLFFAYFLLIFFKKKICLIMAILDINRSLLKPDRSTFSSTRFLLIAAPKELPKLLPRPLVSL